MRRSNTLSHETQAGFLMLIVATQWSRKASVLDICGPQRPAAGENIEFVNTVALVLRHMGKIPECCRNINDR
jgi:hypothetical protein